MKKLLLSLAIASFALAAQAQTTNVIINITQEKVASDGLSTNSTSLSFSFDQSTKKGTARVDGLNFAYQSYAATFGTNTVPDNFKQWIKNEVVTQLADNYVQQKQQADNAALLAKLTSLLTGNADLLTTGDLSSLQKIANKAP